MKSFSYLLTILALSGFLNDAVIAQDAATDETTSTTTAATEEAPVETADASSTAEAASQDEPVQTEEPVQSGPLIDLFGPQMLRMEIIDETTGQLTANYTNEILAGKKVIGLYFSADWCGPCQQFTPELVSFYERMNNRRGKKDQFEIVWISRCRDINSYAQYFTQMPWIALPPDEATGERGQWLGDKYKVQGIPSLVLIDDLGETITIDARNKIPQDKAGIGFPWRGPFAQIYVTFVPRSLRLMVKSQIDAVKSKVVGKLKSLVGMNKRSAKPMGA